MTINIHKNISHSSLLNYTQIADVGVPVEKRAVNILGLDEIALEIPDTLHLA